MGEILGYTREGDQITMKVQLDSGYREKWTYVKNGSSIIQVGKEDLRK